MARSIRQRALVEMNHRSVGAGFRRGRYSGPSTRELRADALARRAEDVAGARLVAHDPWARRRSPVSPLQGLVALGMGIAIGYAIGEWLKRSRETHLHGLDVLSTPTIH
jgi:hypothetical protein